MTTSPSVADPFVGQAGPLPSATEGGPLSGKRFAVKDNFDLAGWAPRAGSPDWAATHPPARRHASVVEQLLAAGAGVIGRTVMDELAYGIEGLNVHDGAPDNPAAPGALCGGSSCGSAAACAAGRVDFALGTDTAGSIRVPASWTGCYGWRPTHGRLSLEGVVPLSPPFDTVGVLAARGVDLVGAARVLLDAEPRWAPRPLVHVPSAWGLVDNALRSELERAAAALGAWLGEAAAAEIAADGLGPWREALHALQSRGIQRSLGAWFECERPAVAPWIGARFEAALRVSEDEVRIAEGTRDRARYELDAALRHGWLCMPVTAGAPLARGAGLDEHAATRGRVMPLMAPACLGGLPQVVLPVRTVSAGPSGLSLVGRRGDDEALLGVLARHGAR